MVTKKYSKLNLGSIKPQGWIKKQLEIQSNGLSGNIDEIWEDLGPDNKWLGGKKEGWERGPYYVDGLIPLAYLLEDEKLIKKVNKWINAFLNNQQKDGWIGPEKPEEDRYPKRDYWPVFIVLKALTQYYEVSSDEKVIEVMNNFLKYLDNSIDERPLFSWAKYRWADLIISIDWLYEKTNEKWLMNLSKKIKEQGYNWIDHFLNFEYTEKSLEVKMETHVVNNAMGIKAPALCYSHSNNKKYYKANYKAIENLDKFHGQANGTFSGDEHLAGKNPSQGTELCAVVEYMYSLEKINTIIEDVYFADKLEKIAYNALPATLSPDICSHQYDQQVNQAICSVAKRNWTNGPDANIFGLEPNFGCCTANMHQGWPKYVSNSWIYNELDVIMPIVYCPSQIKHTLKNGNVIKILEKTEYPFDEEINFTIKCKKNEKFTLRLRIPKWTTNAKIYLSDGELLKPKSGEFISITREWNNNENVKLILPMSINIERRYMGSITVNRGPLVYSLKLGEKWKKIGGNKPFADWEVYPTELWNYALKVDLKNPEKSFKIVKNKLIGNPFNPDNAPIELNVKGKLIDNWMYENNWVGEIPNSPIRSNHKLEELTLIPYGSTNIRITEFPYLY